MIAACSAGNRSVLVITAADIPDMTSAFSMTFMAYPLTSREAEGTVLL
jgi:hypothetical protein